MHFDIGTHRVLLVEVAPVADLKISAKLSPTIELDNYDYVITEMKGLWGAFAGKYNGITTPPEVAKGWKRYLTRLLDWVERGQNLIFIVNESLGTPDGQSQWLNEPFVDMTLSSRQGSNVRYVGPEIGDGFNLRDCAFHTVVSGDSIVPIYVADRKSKGHDLIVGGLMKRGRGNILFVPHVRLEWVDAYKVFAGHCIKIIEKYSTRKRGTLPEWTNQYRTNSENAAFLEIEALQKQIDSLHEKISELQTEISEIERLKALISGTDDEAECAVRHILKALGAKVSSEIPRRAESLVLWKDRLVALEVKGLTGSSAESWLRQTNVWCEEAMRAVEFKRGSIEADADVALYARALDEIGVSVAEDWPEECFGLLVSVTHRLKPFHERSASDLDYPPKMIDKLNSSRVVAVTGVQLLCLYLECKDSPAEAASLLDDLLSGCGGVFPRKGDRAMLIRVL